MVNKKYLEGLSESDQKKKIKNLKETKKLLKEGKQKEAEKLARKRPTTDKTKTSSFTLQFKKMHPDVKPLSRGFTIATGIPLKIQKEVFKRGQGAFLSSGSRSSVKNPNTWAYARLYAFYIKSKKGVLDFDKDLVKKINIK